MPACIGDIAQKARLVRFDTPLKALLRGLIHKPDCQWMTLVREKRPIGILARASVMEAALMSGETRDALTAHDLAVKKPLIIDAKTDILDLARMYEADDYARVRAGCIVTRDRKYAGLLTLPALLKAVTQIQSNAAPAPVEPLTVKAEEKPTQTPQSLLLGTLAHEIRTPLTAMMGLADVLASRVSTDEYQDIAQTIVQSGGALDRILRDTLDYSRLGAGKLENAVEDADLTGLVNDLRKLWGPQASKRGLSLRVAFRPDGPHRIQTDLGRVRQIVNNLVSNALKFTPDGEVSISIGTQALGHRLMLGVEVADTGRGIPDAQKDAFFEAFQTGEAQPNMPGWGLGLTISRALATHMGGKLSVADNPGGGTVFTLLVPVEPSKPLGISADDQLPRTGRFEQGRILLVEDHEACAMVAIHALETAGWCVQHASMVEQADMLAARERFQAIITDLHLTDGSGLTLIDSVRRRGGPSADAPIIALTADIAEGGKKAALAMGADKAVSKPVKGPALVAMVADAVLSRQTGAPRVKLRGRMVA